MQDSPEEADNAVVLRACHEAVRKQLQPIGSNTSHNCLGKLFAFLKNNVTGLSRGRDKIPPNQALIKRHYLIEVNEVGVDIEVKNFGMGLSYTNTGAF